MSWQVYLIISIFFISCNGLLTRSLMKGDKAHPHAQAIAFLGLGGCLATLLALVQGTLNLSFPPSLLGNFLLLAVLLVPGYLCAYHAYKRIGASEMVLSLATGRMWNVLGAAVFLHETVTGQRLLGALIILLGIIIARFEKRKLVVNSGMVFGLIASFFYGMSDIDGYYILRSVQATDFLIYAEVLPVIALIIIYPKALKSLRHYFQRDTGTKLILLSFCDVFGTLALYLSYQAGGAASVIGPLSATRVLVTTALAMLILKERTHIVKKLVGAVVTAIGVILLL